MSLRGANCSGICETHLFIHPARLDRGSVPSVHHPVPYATAVLAFCELAIRAFELSAHEVQMNLQGFPGLILCQTASLVYFLQGQPSLFAVPGFGSMPPIELPGALTPGLRTSGRGWQGWTTFG